MLDEKKAPAFKNRRFFNVFLMDFYAIRITKRKRLLGNSKSQG